MWTSRRFLRGDGTGLAEGTVVPAIDALPDSMQSGLTLVFVGTAAGHRSAAVGHYYAHPGNRFWPTLHETGLTPRRYDPHEFPRLLELGIGFTDVAKRASGMDHEIPETAFEPLALRTRLRTHRPHLVAFTSKRAASLWFGRPTKHITIGLQPTVEGEPSIFVLPSPSGAASRYWSIAPWHELATLVRATQLG
jgi:double-stranded uracil-DNA glycosylase